MYHLGNVLFQNKNTFLLKSSENINKSESLYCGVNIQLLELSKTSPAPSVLRHGQGTPPLSRRLRWYHRSAGVKTTGKILNIKLKKKTMKENPLQLFF